MSNSTDLLTIDATLLASVSGGETTASGSVKLPTGGEGSGSYSHKDDQVRQYGSSERAKDYLGCKEQAYQNFGGTLQSKSRLDKEFADCNTQFGK